MVLGDFFELPPGARKLIIYYTLGMFDLVGFYIVIYMFVLGFDVIVIGVLYSYLLILTAVLKLILGRLIDIRIPPKYLMVVVELLSCLYWLVLFWARTLFDFIILYSISAVSSIFFVAFRPIERDLYPQDKLEIAYKHHMFWPYFFQFFLLLIYGLILNSNFVEMFRILVIFAAMMSVLRIVYVLAFIPKTKPIKSKNGDSAGIRRALSRGLVLVILAELIIIIAFDIAPTFVLDNYLFNVIGVNILGISIIYSLGGLMGALSAIIYDKIRRVSAYGFVYVSLLVLSTYPLIIYYSQYTQNPFTVILLAMMIAYFVWPLWWIIHEVIMMRSVPSHLRGTIFGAVSAIRTIIAIPLPIIAALLISINPLTPLLIQATLFLTSIPLYYLALKSLAYKLRQTTE